MKSDSYERYNDPTSIVLILLAVLALFSNWAYMQRQPGIDYYAAWANVDAKRNNENYRIYDHLNKNQIKDQYRAKALSEGKMSRRSAFAKVPLLWATGSPFLYATVNVLSTSNYEQSLTIWNALSLLGFSTAILLMCHVLGFSKTASLAIFVSCLLWMEAFHSDIRVGNANSIQLGVLALAYWLLSRDFKTFNLLLAGALIALLACLKPNLAPVAPLLLGAWLIQGQQRKFFLGITGMAAGALFAVGVSSFLYGGFGIWHEWLAQLFDLAQIDMPTTQGHYDLLRSLGLATSATDRVVAAVLICAVPLAFMWWGRRGPAKAAGSAPDASRERALIEYGQMIGMGCLVYMLVAPLVWLHYFVLAVPMLIVAFRPWSRAPAHGTLGIILLRLMPALVFLSYLEGPHWRLIHRDFFTAHAITYIASIVILFVVGLWQLRFPDDRLPARVV